MKLTLEQILDGIPLHLQPNLVRLWDGRWLISIWDGSRGKMAITTSDNPSAQSGLVSTITQMPAFHRKPESKIKNNPLKYLGR